MEWGVVEHVQTGCTSCRAHEGPFLACSIEAFPVVTAEGQVTVDTQLAFCMPTERREGCAGQIARSAGYAPPDILELLNESARAALDRAAELEAKVAELEQSQMNVVPVDKLLELIGEKGEKSGADRQ